jgi:hypothetical protein
MLILDKKIDEAMGTKTEGNMRGSFKEPTLRGFLLSFPCQLFEDYRTCPSASAPHGLACTISLSLVILSPLLI